MCMYVDTKDVQVHQCHFFSLVLKAVWIAASAVAKFTHLGYALQGAVEASVAMMLRVVDACAAHLSNRRQQYAHRSAKVGK